MARYIKRRRVLRRRPIRRIARYSRRINKRSYARRKRTYARRKSGKRAILANKYVCWKSSFTSEAFSIPIQGDSQDFFGARKLEFNLNQFTSTNPALAAWNQYQQFRFKYFRVRFIPFKRPMTAQILTPATTRPMNPPKLEGYVVPVIDQQTFSVQTDLSNILEQAGCKKIKNLENGFSVAFIPKVEQIRQYAVLGNTYSTVRRPWFSTSVNAAGVVHFGQCVYIRYPYDNLMPAGQQQEVQRFQVEVTAMIEFKGYDA